MTPPSPPSTAQPGFGNDEPTGETSGNVFPEDKPVLTGNNPETGPRGQKPRRRLCENQSRRHIVGITTFFYTLFMFLLFSTFLSLSSQRGRETGDDLFSRDRETEDKQLARFGAEAPVWCCTAMRSLSMLALWTYLIELLATNWDRKRARHARRLVLPQELFSSFASLRMGRTGHPSLSTPKPVTPSTRNS